MAAAIFATMTVVLLIMSEYVFLEPYMTGHVPAGRVLGLHSSYRLQRCRGL